MSNNGAPPPCDQGPTTKRWIVSNGWSLYPVNSEENRVQALTWQPAVITT